MSDPSPWDPGAIAATAIIVVVMGAVLIRLIPLLALAVWKILPMVLIIALIVGVIRGMFHQLFR